MANIGGLYNDLLAKVKQLTVFKFVQIWNNQLQQLADGTTYSFPMPCAFIEIVPPNYLPLGGGYSVSDLSINIHIGHEQYDAGNGNFEQNTSVFALRDAVITHLNSYQPIACSSLIKGNEAQDYEHTNIYHYIVEFRTAFIDSMGSIDQQTTSVTGEIDTLETNAVVDLVNLYDKFDETFDITFNFYG